MPTPLTADQFVAVLEAEGVKVAEYPGWRTRERDAATGKPFGPVHGVLIHHTAGSNSLATVAKNGRPGLPAPLAHTHLAKSGLATMCSAGRANHAGLAAKNAYNAVLNESSTHPKPSEASGTVDGNDCLYGLEIENLGNGKDPYPAVQYDAAVRWAAAICRAHGWGADSVAGHKETSIEGKIDPSFDMGKFRRDVAARLKEKPSGTHTSTSSGSKRPVVDLSQLVAAAKSNPKAKGQPVTYAGVKTVEAALVAEGLLSKSLSDGHFGTATVTAYAAWQRRCGWHGKDADGIPGKASLTKLGKRRGFDVKE
jgi:hypothetical protein